MDAGGLAGCIDGKLVTIWTRKKEMFTSEIGKAETSLGRGQQGWVAAGPEGAYLVWLQARPGQLLCVRPGQKSPTVLAARASDPVVAGSPDGQGPVVAVWEELRGGGVELRAQVLSPTSR